MTESEWLNLKFEHPLLQSAEVMRVVYQGHLGAVETLAVTLNTTESAASLAELMQTPLAFSIENNASLWHFNTVLSAVCVGEVDELLHRNHFTLHWSSPLIQLKDTRKSSALYHANLSETFSYLLADQQVFETAVIHCNLGQYLPPFKSSEESDFVFFQRILAFYGLTYYFDHSKKDAPLVITDQVTAFGQTLSVPVFTHVNGAVVSAPFIDQVFPSSAASTAAISCTGHPDADPLILFESRSSLNPSKTNLLLPGGGGLGWRETQADFAERSDVDTASHSQFLAESMAGDCNRTRYLGGGLVFPSQILKDQSQLLVKTVWTVDMDGHLKNRIKSVATEMMAQPIDLPYRDAVSMWEEEQILAGHALSGSDIGMSTSVMGHYEVELPAYFIENQSGETLEDTRMLYPVQSDDHGHHYTLIKDAEGIQFWFGGNLAQNLLLGTSNSVDSPQLTQESTYQNAYWQDNQLNKLAFLNQAPFDSTASTGRLSSHVLETPEYHPEGASSLFRMGDAHPIEGAYPAQAGETGILVATTGNYQEAHEGAMLALAGNFGEDPFNPLPALRHRVEVAPGDDSAHLLQSVNAHLHTASATSTQVTEIHELTEGTLTHSLTSPDHFKTHIADETREVQVNQIHDQKGDANTHMLDTHLSNTHALQKTLMQEGKLRQDVFTQRDLLLTHTENTHQQVTHIKNTKELWEAIASHNSNASTHTKTAQTATDQATNLALVSSTLATLATTTHINSNTDIDTTDTSVPPPNTAAALNLLGVTAIEDEQSPLKKEIVFLLDDPDGLIQSPPQLQVNEEAPQTLSKNAPFIYPLGDTQKQGSIQFLYPLAIGTAAATLHPQIRTINIQRNTPVQMPKAWFTNSGKLPAYAGFQTVPGATGVDFNDVDSNVVMLAVTDVPPAELQTAQGYQVRALSDDSVMWIMSAIFSVHKTLPTSNIDSGNPGLANTGSGWKWYAPEVSDYFLLLKDGGKAFLIQEHRRFVLEFLYKGKFVVKEVRGQWMLIFRGTSGLRQWIKGTAYSIEGAASETNKVRIFKTYANMLSQSSTQDKISSIAKNLDDETPLNLIIIAPIDVYQYFFLDEDPHKKISDLFVNIGLDAINIAVGTAIFFGIIAAIGIFSTELIAAGAFVVVGIAAVAVFGYFAELIEKNTGLKAKLIELGRKAEDHFIAQGDKLECDWDTEIDQSATILTKAKSILDSSTLLASFTEDTP